MTDTSQHADGATPAPRPRIRKADHTIELTDPALATFWRERHLVTLTTPRADGRPHVVPVGATLDVENGLARVITSGDSLKVKHIRRAGPQGAAVALCQVDGRYWATIEGRARILDSADEVAEAVRRYADRYGQPRENPKRVVVAVSITRVLGNLA
ncbi:MAG: TIGR03618 family F420-dependent PPOX class oxidoreductase [Dermatophilus congolensis]|nr:TIGR03618 family F420-dependent PPOX class oxidoreductase [Dermatophilus congolensis]